MHMVVVVTLSHHLNESEVASTCSMNVNSERVHAKEFIQPVSILFARSPICPMIGAV